ncbi:MAG TPA: NusG domain II-containing protein [Geopsychrobacteraceae bacterium]|nr:NusG domain II-containing protein [Geopsychrobacteraceae bacterium]
MALADLWKRLTPFDRYLVLVLVLLVGASFLLPFSRRSGAEVIVDVQDRTVFTAPLDQARRFDIEGPLGMTQVEIDNGAVRMLSSPCPQKICIGLGKARRTGDLLACVPNRIVVRIEGDNEEAEYDLLSR